MAVIFYGSTGLVSLASVHPFYFTSNHSHTRLTGLFETILGEKFGLFLYHPWYLILGLLNILGFFLLKNQRLWNLTIILVFLSLWVVNGAWGSIGDSFGNRVFIETLIPLSFGAAMTLDNIDNSFYRIIRLPVLVSAGVLIVFNIYLWGGYLLQKYPHHSERTISEVYLWIIR